MSNLGQINAFIAVLEARSFAQAARAQGVSTAAISRQVSALEEALGVSLLTRTTRVVKPTEVGQRYYEASKAALVGLLEAESAITGSLQEATGTLRVTSNRYFAIRKILPRLNDFMDENPKLKVKLELAERFPDLHNENIDLVFGVGLMEDPHLVQKRVASTHYVLCASPEYLAEHGAPEKPLDLKEHLYITHSGRNPHNVVKFKNGEEVVLEPRLCLNDSRAMCFCAMKGLGIVKLHHYMVEEFIEEGKLVEILGDYQEPEQMLYLYYEENKYLQPKIRKFIDFFVPVVS